MKQTLRFDQISCRLQVEGFPDVSAGQAPEAIGIITGWTLQWAGRPELEGRKDHLIALMRVVLPYARLLISGVTRPLGQATEPVEIGPTNGGHRLLLRSSQPDTPPLEVELDDAELADLVRVLDQARLDGRMQLPLALPADAPLKGRELVERIPKRQRLAGPMAAVALLAISSGLLLLWPAPRPLQESTKPATPNGKLSPQR